MTVTNECVRLAVVGVGLIGQRHARLVSELEKIKLVGLVDPSVTAKTIAEGLGVDFFREISGFLESGRPCDGVIIATPNETHLPLAQTCLERGLPCLIEKPVAANSADALKIAELSETLSVPVLVGHHRRHHEVSRLMKNKIANGDIGRVVGGQLTWMLKKPDDYFTQGEWRTRKGGGPVWINLIHEIDLLRYFLGEIVEVSAMLSSAVRQHAVEDTGVINMRFENRALVSAVLSDAAPSPWHFEGGSGENPNIARTGEDGMRIFGTKASLAFPSMTQWQHDASQGNWADPIFASSSDNRSTQDGEVALKAQVKHFAEIIAGKAKPLVSARDGLQSVRVVEAVHEAAKNNSVVTVEI